MWHLIPILVPGQTTWANARVEHFAERATPGTKQPPVVVLFIPYIKQDAQPRGKSFIIHLQL